MQFEGNFDVLASQHATFTLPSPLNSDPTSNPSTSNQGSANLYPPLQPFELQDFIPTPQFEWNSSLAFQSSLFGKAHAATSSISESNFQIQDTSPVRFDALTGAIVVRGDNGDNILHESISKQGYYELNLDGLLFSSDSHSKYFSQALAGATRETVKALNFEGGLGHDKLIIDRQNLSQSLNITADDEVDISGNITSKGDLNITADRIDINAKVKANSVLFNAANVLNFGEIKTKDSTTINFTDKYTDGSLSSISGKKIGISGGTTGILETSGKYVAKDISLLGDRVSLLGANIDASGKHGGGTVLIGGDYQGKGVERGIVNATNTVVDKNTVIRADALENGNGGKVIIWSDQETVFDGNVSVKGGSKSGDGGFIEVSGKKELNFTGQVDTSAVNGQYGTLLLDPTDIYIGPDDQDPNTYDVSDLNRLTGNVILSATNNITMYDAFFVDSTGTITIQADSDRDGVGTVTIKFRNVDGTEELGGIWAGNRNVDISGADVNVGDINSRSGNVTVNATNTITTGYLTGDKVDVYGANINVGGVESRSGGITIIATDSITSNNDGVGFLSSDYGGSITVTAKNSISLASVSSEHNNGNPSLNSNGNSGNVTIKSTMGKVFVGTLSNSSLNANAGKIDIRAKTSIQVYFLDSRPFSAGGGYSESSPLGSVFMSADDSIEILGFLTLGKSVDAQLISKNSNVSIGLTTIARSNGIASNLKLDAKSGIQMGSVNSSAQVDWNAGDVDGNAGNVDLKAGGDIEVEAIDTSASGMGNGGFINLQSLEGNVRIANVDRYNGFYPPSSNYLRSDSFGGSAGNITINAAQKIATGSIDASAQDNGNAGAVTLTAVNDIEAGAIKANVGGNGTGIGVGGKIVVDGKNLTIESLRADSVGGLGGDITLVSNKLIKVTGTTLVGGNNYSIYTDSVDNGSQAIGANIFIKDQGTVTLNQVPFVIGNATINGTSGVVSDGVATFGNGIHVFVSDITFNNIQIKIPVIIAGDPSLPLSTVIDAAIREMLPFITGIDVLSPVDLYDQVRSLVSAATNVTFSQVLQIAPNAYSQNVNDLLPYLNVAMAVYTINTPIRKSHFFAQLLQESGAFNYTEEIASGWD